jgi:sugar lactone lactonase YvrE
MKKRAVTVFADGLKFPEGPAFDRRGNLFVVNIDTGDISKISPEGLVETFVNTSR